jgi:ABC-type multidrug transport system fused ATPase/permease subunit
VVLTKYTLAHFSWMRNYSISRRLLSNYLNQPYKYFLDKNSSLLGKNILSEVQLVTKGVLIPYLEIFSRSIVSFLIFLMLLLIEPVLGIAIIIILSCGYILSYRLIRKKLYAIGDSRYQTNAEQFKSISEAFGDIRLVKLKRKEDYFIDSYSKSSSEWARNNAVFEILGQIPRYIIEIIIFGGVIVVILYLLARSQGLENFLPLIGLYAFASYRFIPALQEIFKGIAKIRFNARALEVLYKDMDAFKKKDSIKKEKIKKTGQFYLKKELKLEKIKFSYDKGKKPFINDLSLKIEANTSVALIGPTGSGKTTLANIILGLLVPDEGKVLVDEKEVDQDNLQQWQINLGYIPQDIYLQDDTVKNNIAFGICDDEINMDHVIRSSKIANIHDFIIKQLHEGYDTIIGEKGIKLSGGQRQRIGIARALYEDPEVLVLDEATSSLDMATEKEVFKAIENVAKSKTLIIIAHRLTTVKKCDAIHIIEKGNIISSGRFDDLINSNKDFKRIIKAYLE